MSCENEDLSKLTTAELEIHREFHLSEMRRVRHDDIYIESRTPGIWIGGKSPDFRTINRHGERLTKIDEVLTKNKGQAHS